MLPRTQLIVALALGAAFSVALACTSTPSSGATDADPTGDALDDVAAVGDDATDDAETDDAETDGAADAPVSNDTSDVTGDDGPPAPPLPGPPDDLWAFGVFVSAGECATCHSSDGTLFRDSANRDVSPHNQWSSSLMAMSARDPYWLAQFSLERELFPGAAEHIDAVCTRCHAPAASEALRHQGEHSTFELVTGNTDVAGHAAREGVTCSLCHQIGPDGLGTPESFTGGYLVGEDRQIFGPHADPLTGPMVNHLNYEPVHSDHIRESAQCATCHTVITNAVGPDGSLSGPDFPEQVPFLEWSNSTYAADGTATCQTCHVPRVDEDGAPLSGVLSQRPPWLDTERPYGRHSFLGGNAYMLDLLADNREWAGIAIAPEVLRETARRTRENRTGGARISVAGAADGDTFVLDVTLENLTGHKFPTAYPTRRAWIDVHAVDDAGQTVWRSGGWNDAGVLVTPDGTPIALPQPHRDEISSETEVLVYEAVMADADGVPTHSLLEGVAYTKDNRLLPRGWSADHEYGPMTAPIGLDGDENHVAGSDVSTYRVPAAGVARVDVALRYQSIPPEVPAGHAERAPTEYTETLAWMMARRPPVPEEVAAVSWTP